MEQKKSENYLEEIMRLNNELIDIQRELQKKNKNLQDTNAQLERALAEIRTLKGLLPICIRCKKIRDDDGYWQEVDHYFRLHSDLEFSHGYCEKCFRELYPECADEIIKDIECGKRSEK